MSSFKDDLGWSGVCMEIAHDKIIELFQQIPDLFGNRKLVIHPVEGIKENTCILLDKNCGIDYFISTEDGNKTVSFAWRAVNSTVERCRNEGVYNAFSLRKKRNNSQSKTENCEIEKRLYAIEHRLVYPLFTVEAYVLNGRLLSVAVARTEDVFDAYKNLPIRNCDPYSKNKEVFFLDVSWKIMKDNGYTVYDWYYNDKCKQTYRLHEYKKYDLAV